MKIDETELIEFFGVLPVTENPEEKEFFGSTTFDVKDRDITLSISFGSQQDDVSMRIYSTGRDDLLLTAKLTEITDVKVSSDHKFLEVVGNVRGVTGKDPQLKQRVLIAVDPLQVKIEDGSRGDKWQNRYGEQVIRGCGGWG